MAEIKILSEDTIDKIAAGEVVERPMNVVKELVENAMDAGADAITIEIKNGGIDLIRVTDNGQGIPAHEVRIAFLRHSTSKIRSVEDLGHLSSMGFRGEALSSIAAVSQTEVITKTADSLTGVRYAIDGAIEKDMEEVGAPEGTTFLIKNLFFNTPARRKFLKQPPTEAGYVAELLERLALARPDISFKYIQNGQVKFHTPGNGDLKEVIYRIYGREIANQLIPIEIEKEHIKMRGFLGKPEINRSNRNFEHYFINARYVKSKILAKAIEDGYKQYVMQHKFPFVVLHFVLPPEEVDVNVHPSKMEVRFSDEPMIYKTVAQAIIDTFRSRELVVASGFGKDEKPDRSVNMPVYDAKKIPDSFMVPKKQHPVAQETASKPEVFSVTFEEPSLESRYHAGANAQKGQTDGPQAAQSAEQRVQADIQATAGTAQQCAQADMQAVEEAEQQRIQTDGLKASQSAEQRAQEFVPAAEEAAEQRAQTDSQTLEEVETQSAAAPEALLADMVITDGKQETLFEEPFLSEKAKESYDILGQIFGTYWLIAYSDRLYMIDQHAAHEKVKYERLVKALAEKSVVSQAILPPVILQTNAAEERAVLEHMDSFTDLGFELEEFGDHTFCLRAVPVDLYGCSYQELFREVLDELMEGAVSGDPKVVTDKLASMACKAAVKGNNRLSRQEAEALIDELLTLENPYHCPHGRPTIISMTKYEIEKKFKRIV